MVPGAAAVVGTEMVAMWLPKSTAAVATGRAAVVFLQEINAFPQAFSTSQALNHPIEDPVGAAVLYDNRHCPFKKCDVRHYSAGHTLSVVICQQV